MIFSQSMRRGVFAAATALLLLPAVANAQQSGGQAGKTSQPAADEVSPSHLQAARAAIRAIHATDQFDEILPNAATQIKSELIANRPDMEAKISDMVDAEALKLAPRRAALETEIARAYAKLFTEDELKAIAQFYNSEAGKKLLEQGPQATREMIGAAQVWSNGIARDLRQAAFDDFSQMTGEAPKAGQPK
ncbi:DUF2059 domain-containing protein [Jiella flava]|uniref:DUF2059 domain-containing protein n=1 Tax=Jiella flava TaxID=2816857 RepID=A0A939FY18_9HYPH|nr:DUF2059 domain-containing protein [Jiella flava]